MSSLKQSPIKAKAYRAAGLTSAFAALGMGLAFTPLASVVPAYAAYLLLRRAKKHTAVGGDTVLSQDTRPPVLYLRSFQDETSQQAVLHRFTRAALPERTWLALGVPNNAVQEQDALGHVFRKVGPYVALGKPGEELPELGSSKMYVPNAAWQERVRALIGTSRLIVFQAGRTEGLRWELNELVRTVNPVMLLVILPVTTDDYASFVRWANLVLPRPLPSEYPSSRIVVFDRQWAPAWLPPRQSLTESLAPFFKQNGLTVTETFWEKTLEHNGLRW
jgi:hypothetical protein